LKFGFYCYDVTCLKRFTRYGHYAGEVKDIITQTAVSSDLKVLYKSVIIIIIDSQLSPKSLCQK